MKFSSLSRIYTTSIAKNQIIVLNEDIFHYCKSVLQMKNSEEFRLFNNIDGEFKAEIRAINKHDLQLDRLNRSTKAAVLLMYNRVSRAERRLCNTCIVFTY